jgi:preprotein translocase subunit YajC
VTGALSALLAASSGTTKSSGGSTFIIFLVLIAVVGYFLLIRPQKQKQRRQREQQQAVSVGDDVLTVGGIVGKVIAVDADRVTILSGGDTVGFAAAGNDPTRLVLVRSAIARKVDPPIPDATSGSSLSDGVADLSDGVADPAKDGEGALEDHDGDDPFASHLSGNGHLDGHLDDHDRALDAAEDVRSESEGTGT